MRCESEAKHLDLALGQDEAAQQYGPQALKRPFSTVIRVIVVSLQETPFDVTTTWKLLKKTNTMCAFQILWILFFRIVKFYVFSFCPIHSCSGLHTGVAEVLTISSHLGLRTFLEAKVAATNGTRKVANIYHIYF